MKVPRFTWPSLRLLAALLTLSTFGHQLTTAFAQSTAFTYQGKLTESGSPANGIYQMAFDLYDASSGGNFRGSSSIFAVPVTNGLFTVTVDYLTFDVFPGEDRWLEIGVRTNGGGGFNYLSPRQQITSTPYAVRAASASSVAATNINGKVSDAALSTNVAFLNANNVFTGSNSFTGKLTSPKWNVTQVFTNAAGPLPRTNTFTSGGGTLVIAASGTAYTSSSPQKIGMNVIVNGVNHGVCSIFANLNATHLAFSPGQFVVRNIPAGTNTLILSPLPGTLSDANDVFNVTVTELPF